MIIYPLLKQILPSHDNISIIKSIIMRKLYSHPMIIYSLLKHILPTHDNISEEKKNTSYSLLKHILTSHYNISIIKT